MLSEYVDLDRTFLLKNFITSCLFVILSLSVYTSIRSMRNVSAYRQAWFYVREKVQLPLKPWPCPQMWHETLFTNSAYSPRCKKERPVAFKIRQNVLLSGDLSRTPSWELTTLSRPPQLGGDTTPHTYPTRRLRLLDLRREAFPQNIFL